MHFYFLAGKAIMPKQQFLAAPRFIPSLFAGIPLL